MRVKYNSLIDMITLMDRYAVPNYLLHLHEYIHSEKTSELFDRLTDNIPLIYYNRMDNWGELYKSLLDYSNNQLLKQKWRFEITPDGGIIDYDPNGELMQCENCNRVWDGYAQCTCQ